MSDTSIVLAKEAQIASTLEYVAISLLVLDRSGSMDKYGDEPKVQANAFLDELANDPNAAHMLVGIATFANTMSVDVPFTSASRHPHLASYRADGNTLFYATVNECLRGLKLVEDERLRQGLRTDVILNALTDGVDTHSPRGSLDILRLLAAEGRRRRWQMQVFGFGIDGSHIAQTIGFTEGAAPSDGCGGYTVPATREGMSQVARRVMRQTMHTTNVGVTRH